MSAVHVGLDLAWSRGRPSGVAAVDRTGRVIDSGVVLSDDDLLAWVERAGDPLVLGIDAPVHVPNATGMREAEKELSRAYSRFGAGPRPTSRTDPLFDPPRAEELAARAGWSRDVTDPARPGAPLAIEVYPHPMLVWMFSLPRRLAYKRGPDRRAELSRLFDLLETVDVLAVEHHDRWPGLRETVRTGRGAALKAAEDEIDAIVCAHVAWLWHERPGTLRLYGTPGTGPIVGPRPPTHVPGGWTP